MAQTPKTAIRTLVRQSRSIDRFVRRSLRRDAPPPLSRTPAFDEETRDWFNQQIARCSAYLEFGAGASTLIAADHAIPSASVESDAAYAEAVRAALPASHRATIVHADIGATEDWGYPVVILATRARVARWRRYVEAGREAIETLPAFPDLILVDGRFRRACALTVAHAARTHGATGPIDLLFDDYAGRSHYKKVERFLGEPRMIGRAALFASDGWRAEAIDDAAIDEAVADFR